MGTVGAVFKKQKQECPYHVNILALYSSPAYEKKQILHQSHYTTAQTQHVAPENGDPRTRIKK